MTLITRIAGRLAKRIDATGVSIPATVRKPVLSQTANSLTSWNYERQTANIEGRHAHHANQPLRTKNGLAFARPQDTYQLSFV